MSQQAQRDRITPWFLLLVLVLVVWLGLKLDADASSAAAILARETPAGRPPDEGTEGSASGAAGRFLEPEELPGFGKHELLPALLEALGDADCDFDDPFSPCQ